MDLNTHVWTDLEGRGTLREGGEGSGGRGQNSKTLSRRKYVCLMDVLAWTLKVQRNSGTVLKLKGSVELALK